MKTLTKQFAILMVILLSFVGGVNGQTQYEIAVLSDSNQWIAGNWKRINVTNNISTYNFRDERVSGIGGDTVFMQLVDTAASHSVVTVDHWELVDDLGYATNLDSGYYVLPIDAIYFQQIRAYYDATNYIKITVRSKFISPVFILDTADADAKSTLINLTIGDALLLSDFGMPIDNTTADTAYYSSIIWLREKDTISTGLNTTYNVGISDTGTAQYRVRVEVSYVTKSFIIGDTTTKTYKRWISSDTISVNVTATTTGLPDNFNNIESSKLIVYPNPATDYLYISAETDFSVFSIAGEEVLRGTGNKINVADFKSGVYMLKTLAGSTKFIVK